MKSEEMIKKMSTSCKVLNDVLRYPKRYDKLEKISSIREKWKNA